MLKPISKLKYPPLNRIKKPDKLIWLNQRGNDFYDATMVSVKNPILNSYINFYKSENFQENDKLPSLYVLLLFSLPRKEGLGTELLNFAKKFSKQIGCEGRVTLLSESLLSPSEVAHTFYKKNGMNTGFIDIDNKLDEFVKECKPATKDDFPTMRMYYPPVKIADKYEDRYSYNSNLNQIPQRESFFSRIKNLFHNFFSVWNLWIE